MNREGAQQALDVARKRLATGDYSSAIRFAKKSIALDPSSEARAVLEKAEQGARDGGGAAGGASSSSASASTSATSAGPSASTTSSRTARPSSSTSTGGGGGDDDKKRDYTPAQAAVVARIKKCKVTAYYEILELEKSCSDGDVKKAYRKKSLLTHPDKCGAPGAEEAFKMVSKAFTVLSDPQKRAIYDQTGGDPDSRGGGMGGGGGGGGFARHPGFGGGMGGADEINPEDLFRAFFGGGMGGGGFGGPMGGGFGGGPFGGGGTTFQFFGPGMGGVHMGGPGFQQRRPAAGAGGQQGQRSQQSAWVQMAPLLILFAFSFLTQLPSLFGGGQSKVPEYSFDRNARFSHPRTTLSHPTHPISYFVDPQTFPLHPTYRSFARVNADVLGYDGARHADNSPQARSELAKALRREVELQREAGEVKPVEAGEGGKGKDAEEKKPIEFKLPTDWMRFERQVEKDYINRLHRMCQVEINRREEKLDRARGLFGIGTDHAAIARITQERLVNCEALSRVPGYGHVRYN